MVWEIWRRLEPATRWALLAHGLIDFGEVRGDTLLTFQRSTRNGAPAAPAQVTVH